MFSLKKTSKLLMLVSILVLAFSCSENNEVFEEQEPQTQIPQDLSLKMNASTQQSVAVSTFSQNINWYVGLDPTVCNINAINLTYDIYDISGNYLGVTATTTWIYDANGPTLEQFIDIITDSLLGNSAGVSANLIFVSGLLINATDDLNYTYAEVTSYTTFSDYFANCQSPNVTFINSDGVTPWDTLTSPTPQGNVTTPPTPCLSIQFPLDLLVADASDLTQTFQVTVDELQFINYLSGNVPNEVLIDLVYPVTFIDSIGTTHTANSVAEVDQLYAQYCP